MGNENVKHFLDLYKLRLKMQLEGVTNPTQEIKDHTKHIVEKLSELPLDEEVVFKDLALFRKSGELIVKFPKSKTDK